MCGPFTPVVTPLIQGSPVHSPWRLPPFFVPREMGPPPAVRDRRRQQPGRRLDCRSDQRHGAELPPVIFELCRNSTFLVLFLLCLESIGKR